MWKTTFVASCLWIAPNAQAQESVTPGVRFVQITDAHIFDDGWKLPVADAMRQAADDRDALTWSLREVNAMVARGERVDFVVYSGDFGLQNVDFAGSGCQAVETSLQPGLGPFELRAALDEIATQIEALTVKRVYFTPGNNDLSDEKIEDAGRFDCFVNALRARLEADRSEVRAVVMGPAEGFVYGGVRFLALDTAMFKNRRNYEEFCAKHDGGAEGAKAREACPEQQIHTLDRAIRHSAEPVAVFMHVPDLNDPYRKTSSWEISSDLRRDWEKTACSEHVAGLFAGHFHDANRDVYGVPSRALERKECTGRKTFVAPPLAAKNQVGKAVQARGLMVVEISDAKTVTASVTWYPGRAVEAGGGASVVKP